MAKNTWQGGKYTPRYDDPVLIIAWGILGIHDWDHWDDIIWYLESYVGPTGVSYDSALVLCIPKKLVPLFFTQSQADRQKGICQL